jgi:S-DNA-T family DNA segregation ATPase FtsK/SpoIIIE
MRARREWLGVLLIVVGALLLWSVVRYAPERSAPPLLMVLTGWTAPLFAASLVVLGLVLLFRQRAGYWSAEALLGVELLLLGMMTFSFVRAEGVVNWSARLDGEDGGLVGWALGNLLMALLGEAFAALVAVALVIAGAILLVRYTPLIYLAATMWGWLPVASMIGNDLRTMFSRPKASTTDDWSAVAAHAPISSQRRRRPMQPTPEAPATPTAPTAPTTPRRRPHLPEAVAPTAAPAKTKLSAKAPAPAKAPALRPLRSAAALPPVDLLHADAGVYGNRDVSQIEQLIVNTLEDFNVPVRVVHVESGPTVTQFGVEPLYVESAGQKRKVRVSRIVNLADDLALALAAPAVRIEAPVPGRPYVGIEVPNPDKSLVSLRGILESAELRKGRTMALPLGRNTAGAAVVMDLTKAPHMLIAGATGSGKSVCINAIVAGLLMQHGPESLRFVMVDPKMVELPGYNGIPHLYGKVITDVEQVMGALTWLLIQMDDRYQLFRDLGVRNIDAYNASMTKQKGAQPLPYIVLVIDELSRPDDDRGRGHRAPDLPAGADGARHRHPLDPGDAAP